MAARDTDSEPPPPFGDSAESKIARAQPRQRSVGLWLVMAALGLWLGVMLVTVGPPDLSDEPAAGSPGSARVAAGTAAARGTTAAPGTTAARATAPPSRRVAEPNLTPASRRDPAPGFALPDMDGSTATLADYSGRVLLLNFWATWCLPCRAEMPWFVEFQTAFEDDGFAVLGVSVDELGRDIVEPFLERSPVNYRIALADTVERLAPFGPMNTLPTTWLIDRQGRIAAEHIGLVSREATEAEIRLLLAE